MYASCIEIVMSTGVDVSCARSMGVPYGMHNNRHLNAYTVHLGNSSSALDIIYTNKIITTFIKLTYPQLTLCMYLLLTCTTLRN